MTDPHSRRLRRPRNTLVDPVGMFLKVERDERTRAHEIAESLDMPLSVFLAEIVRRVEIEGGQPVLTDWPVDSPSDEHQEALPLAG